MSSITVSTGYSLNSKKPFVMLVSEDHKLELQMSPEEAADFAHTLLESAEAALQDAFLVEFLQQTLGSDNPNAMIAAVIGKFRDWRAARQNGADQ